MGWCSAAQVAVRSVRPVPWGSLPKTRKNTPVFFRACARKLVRRACKTRNSPAPLFSSTQRSTNTGDCRPGCGLLAGGGSARENARERGALERAFQALPCGRSDVAFGEGEPRGVGAGSGHRCTSHCTTAAISASSMWRSLVPVDASRAELKKCEGRHREPARDIDDGA